MPEFTPKQKISQIEMFGNGMIRIVLVRDTFDDCLKWALIYADKNE